LLSEKISERLIIYKFILQRHKSKNNINIFSHQIAEITGNTASQVRRDLMDVGYSGNQKTGYNIDNLISVIQEIIAPNHTINLVIIGVGNLGKAILRYYSDLSPKYSIVACFDTNKDLIGQYIFHSKCYHINELINIVKNNEVNTGIITVPAAEAQNAADKLIESGIKGIINFAPVRIKTPEDIYIEQIDFSIAVEKVTYFARRFKDAL
jgi:redox-sensing transcriptional repressor